MPRNARGDHDLRAADLLRAVPVSRRLLRLYEEQGLLRPEGLDPRGQRRYGAHALGRLRVIHQLREAGLPASTVRLLVLQAESARGAPERLAALLSEHGAALLQQSQAAGRGAFALESAAAWLRHTDARAAGDPPPLLRDLIGPPDAPPTPHPAPHPVPRPPLHPVDDTPAALELLEHWL